METLKDIFVPYEIAQKLKGIGFEIDTIFCYVKHSLQKSGEFCEPYLYVEKPCIDGALS